MDERRYCKLCDSITTHPSGFCGPGECFYGARSCQEDLDLLTPEEEAEDPDVVFYAAQWRAWKAQHPVSA